MKCFTTKIKLFLTLAIITFFVITSLSLATGEQADTRKVIDQIGKEVTVNAEINRVVTPYPIATNIIYTLGGQSKLVGIDDNSHQDQWLKRIDPGVTDITTVGMPWSVNIETILSLDPDLVIGVSGETRDKLEEVNIPVIELNLGSGADLESAIILIGSCLGLEKNAQELVNFYNERMSLISEIIKEIPLEKRVKVLSIGRDDIYTAAIGGCYQDRMINSAGGINVAQNLTGNGWFTQVSIEQILEWNPEVILVPPYIRKGSVQEILSDPKWQNIAAVKDKRVYSVPKGVATWDTPEPESFITPIWIARFLYPEELKDINIENEIKIFYSQFYHLDISEQEIKQILNPIN
ncbi:MAG: ABC transporter substrate-binding protein [Atribacterota bacterium]|nr:ABC transporter substrate-binding protein [Atribacterota bacterium]